MELIHGISRFNSLLVPNIIKLNYYLLYSPMYAFLAAIDVTKNFIPKLLFLAKDNFKKDNLKKRQIDRYQVRSAARWTVFVTGNTRFWIY